MCHSKVQIFEYRWALYKYTYDSMRIQDTGAHCSYDSNTLHRTVITSTDLHGIHSIAPCSLIRYCTVA